MCMTSNKTRPLADKYNHAFEIVENERKKGNYSDALKILDDMERELPLEDFKSMKLLDSISKKIRLKKSLINAIKKGDEIALRANLDSKYDRVATA